MPDQMLFVHSAGPQGARDGSGPLIAYLRAGLGETVRVHAPAMPTPENPKAAGWEAALEAALSDIGGEVVLVGHSLGGSTILKYLAERPRPAGIAGVISIAAPFWGLEDWAVDEFALPDGLARRLAGIPVILYHSRDDDVVPVSHFGHYAACLPHAATRLLEACGHLFDRGDRGRLLDDVRCPDLATTRQGGLDEERTAKGA